MRSLFTIANREVGSFFHSAVAPLIFAGFLLLVGFTFIDTVLQYSLSSYEALRSTPDAVARLNVSDGIIQPMVYAVGVLLLFLLPAVAMRLFSEEYRSGRYDLIMSWPVSEHHWVIGKFLSVVVIGFSMIFALFPMLIVAGLMAPLELGVIFTSIIGLLFIVMLVAAWGLFFSSLVQYQAVSYVLSFVFLLLLYMASGMEAVLPGNLGDFGQNLSIPFHFRRFSFGTIDSRDVVYFLSLTIVGLFVTTGSLASRRLIGNKKLSRWVPSILLVILLVIVNILVAANPMSADLTSNKRFTPAPQTIQVLQSLKNKVHVDAFYNRTDPNRRALNVMFSYMSNKSGLFSWEMYDPDTDILEVENAGISRPQSVVVSADGRQRTVVNPSESDLVNAIFRVATGSQPVVCFLQGHNEPDLNDESRNGYIGFVNALTMQGYALRSLTMAGNPVVPADASILVIAQPEFDLSDAELVAVEQFVASGGGLLLLLDPGSPNSIVKLAASLNVKLGNDFLVSSSATNNQLGVDGRVQVVVEYPEHPVNDTMPGIATFFPFTQTLMPVGNTPKGLKIKTILKSDDRSWAERDFESLTSGQVTFDKETDTRGPLPFGVAIVINREKHFNGADSGAPLASTELDSSLQGTAFEELVNKSNRTPDPVPSIFNESATSKVIVIGDGDFISNSNINLYGNRDYLLNLVGWLASEKTLIAVRGSNPLAQPVVLTRDQQRWIGWGGMAIWPLLVSLFATLVVVRHRRQ
jgi:ABC-type transport system involved in multi-copper enzyme maturation permease subunit